METYISATPWMSTRLKCYFFSVGSPAYPFRHTAFGGLLDGGMAGPPTPFLGVRTPRYFTFAGFGPFIIFDATAGRAGAAAATALP